MTPEQFDALLGRASSGTALTPAEGKQLRTAITTLRQQARVDTTVWCLREELEQTEAMYLAANRRADRYRAAWQSARRRARYIPEAGQEIHDGTRWRPALQAYSVLRARLTRAEQQLATLHEGEQPVPANGIPRRPGEWIAAWNAQTPAARLQHAQRILDASLEVSDASRQLAAVQALHQPYRSVYDEGDNRSCAHCNQLTSSAVPWPCDTIRAMQ